MFDHLNRQLLGIFKRIRGQARMTDVNISEAVREVRTALLEADVHLAVVRAFTEEIRLKAMGSEVLYSIRPADAFIKIVHDSLAKFLGGAVVPFRLDKRPSLILLMGLQGSGKTTTAGKLAAHFLSQQKSTMLVSLDRTRPAAAEQLEKLATQSGATFCRTKLDAITSSKLAMDAAVSSNSAVLIMDSAGRTEVDKDVFSELKGVCSNLPVEKKILVLDAMMGQAAVNVARAYSDEVGVDGFILTKFDSDTRGGAALSIYHQIRAPILFVGDGEGLNRLSPFHPDRMAGRILGMGDVVSLVERAEKVASVRDTERATKRLAKGDMTFDDFLEQLRALKRMGPLGELLQHLPGGMTGKIKIEAVGDEGEKGIKKIEAIILSMTSFERCHPDSLTPSRRVRIAKGAGVQLEEVHRLIKRFEDFKKMMKKAVKMGMMGG